MNVLWSHTQVAFFISAKFAEAPAACRNLSTQMGVRAATTAVAARFFASVSAVPPVPPPPQLNPTIARIIAPAAAPHSAGFTAAFVSLGISMTFTFDLEIERVSSTHNARRGSPTLRPFLQPLLWPQQRELLRYYRMERRQSRRALASTRGSSRLDNGFPDVRYRPRHPRS